MEIIKRGTPPEEQLYTGTCQRCSTEVRFKRGEASVHSDQRDGEIVSVACPVCPELIYGNPIKLYTRTSGSQWEDR